MGIVRTGKRRKVDERLFQTALNIKSVGKGKLSIVLFYANPERYVPLDSNTSSYLRSKNWATLMIVLHHIMSCQKNSQDSWKTSVGDFIRGI